MKRNIWSLLQNFLHSEASRITCLDLVKRCNEAKLFYVKDTEKRLRHPMAKIPALKRMKQ